MGSVRNVTEPAQKRSGSSWPRSVAGEPGVCVETTPSRQFDFGLGGIANHLAKAGCFIGGRKHHMWTPARFSLPLTSRRKGWGLSAKEKTIEPPSTPRAPRRRNPVFFLCALCGSAVKNSSIQFGRSGFSPTRASRRAEAAPYGESFLRRFREAWGSFRIAAEVVATRGPSIRWRGIIPLGDGLMAKPSPSIRLPDYSMGTGPESRLKRSAVPL